MGFDINEISKGSKGGTELMRDRVAAEIEPGLADDFQIILSRMRELQEEKIRVFWAHDLPGDPESDFFRTATGRNKFHKYVFASEWQYQQYRLFYGLPYDQKAAVIENCIEPIEYVEKSKDEVRLIYASTPHRGLELLVPVFESLAEKHDNIVLDVYSSFNIYGWEDPPQYKELFERCKAHPRINYHGSQPNDVVRAAFQKAHILSYPSIWQETSCLTLMEAMSAGCLCVHPNLAALTDTAGGLTFMYQGDQDHMTHATKFMYALEQAIQCVNDEQMQRYLRFVKTYTDTRFNSKKIGAEWNALLHSLRTEFDTVQSRKIPGEIFEYKVG